MNSKKKNCVIKFCKGNLLKKCVITKVWLKNNWLAAILKILARM